MKFQPLSDEQTKDLELRHRYEDDGRLTNFSHKQPRDKVNIEFDHKTKTIVGTVERVLQLKAKLC